VSLTVIIDFTFLTNRGSGECKTFLSASLFNST